MSYIAQVQADNSGTWAGNGLRFATETEANAYAHDLMCRWTAVRDYRVVPSDDPVDSQWVNGRSLPVGPVQPEARS